LALSAPTNSTPICPKHLLSRQFHVEVRTGTLLAMAAASKTQEVPMENA
jgi:hypothetical protein